MSLPFDNNYIEITTHIGEDTNKMCAFLNFNRIGYTVGECHHLAGFSKFKDYPHYTNTFYIGNYSDKKMKWIQELLKNECRDITFYFIPVNLIEKDNNV